VYIHPEDVLSPKGVQVLEVIHDPGENGVAVARIVWDNEEVVAIRWNGNTGRPRGNPVSHGQPTWFVLGAIGKAKGYLAPAVEQAARLAAERSPDGLAAKYREMALDNEREREAEEWSEGLIGDADSPR
jgi:hypothetical protein